MAKQDARRSALVRELSQLSRNGWAHARPVDYRPLESELAALDRKRITKLRQLNLPRQKGRI